MSVRGMMVAVLAGALLGVSANAETQEPAPVSATAAPSPQICQLGQTASLDLITGGEGMPFLEGTVEGRSGKFLVDTGGLGLVLAFSTATQMKNGPQRGLLGVRMVGGVSLDYGVSAQDFIIGPFKNPTAWFVVAPDGAFPSYAIGNIQPHSMWGSYDIEIDFWKSKLNLFLQNQCPGHVVYWTHQPYAAVPIQLDYAGHLIVQANLDGKLVDAVIDTGAQKSFLSLKTASHMLDIDESSPGMVSLGQIDINGMVQAKRYRYPFKSLTFEGISIANPDIEIDDTGNDSKKAPLILGIGILRQLHLFIAYDENRLYLTSAEAH
jgi:predicted aspartyl protease